MSERVVVLAVLAVLGAIFASLLAAIAIVRASQEIHSIYRGDDDE